SAAPLHLRPETSRSSTPYPPSACGGKRTIRCPARTRADATTVPSRPSSTVPASSTPRASKLSSSSGRKLAHRASSSMLPSHLCMEGEEHRVRPEERRRRLTPALDPRLDHVGRLRRLDRLL